MIRSTAIRTSRCLLGVSSSSCALRMGRACFSTQAPVHTSPSSHNERKFIYLKGVKSDGRSKRFYDRVSYELMWSPRGSEYALLLDDRALYTPHNHVLSVPTRACAQLLALEWDSQGDYIRPTSMPCSNMAVTALDQALVNREKFLQHFNSNMKMDAILLRSAHPPALTSLQHQLAEPLLQFFQQNYQCTLTPTTELTTPPLSPAALGIEQRLLCSLDGWQLSALDSACTVTKSFVLSWCLLHGAIDLHHAYQLARVEEDFQIANYGRVQGIYGHGIDIEFNKMTLAAAKCFSQAAKQSTHSHPPLTQ